MNKRIEQKHEAGARAVGILRALRAAGKLPTTTIAHVDEVLALWPAPAQIGRTGDAACIKAS